MYSKHDQRRRGRLPKQEINQHIMGFESATLSFGNNTQKRMTTHSVTFQNVSSNL